jgi:hypothetical protein
MAIGGNQYYAPIFGAVDALVKQNQDQKAYKRRMDEVENQREYAAKTFREKLIGDLIFNEYRMPDQTPDSLAYTKQQAMDYIQSPDRTPDFYNNFRRAEANQEPVIEKQQFAPSPLAKKYFGDVFGSKELYDPDVIGEYEKEATERERDQLRDRYNVKNLISSGGKNKRTELQELNASLDEISQALDYYSSQFGPDMPTGGQGKEDYETLLTLRKMLLGRIAELHTDLGKETSDTRLNQTIEDIQKMLEDK